MSNEFKKLNEKYNDDTYDVFPYISPFRVTPIKKGLYKKHNAKYRGITAKYDEDQKKFRFFLYGMYRIPNDIVIVPENLVLNQNKDILLNAAIKAGFTKVARPPKFDAIEFPENSEEARMALANKTAYHYSAFNSSSNLTI